MWYSFFSGWESISFSRSTVMYELVLDARLFFPFTFCPETKYKWQATSRSLSCAKVASTCQQDPVARPTVLNMPSNKSSRKYTQVRILDGRRFYGNIHFSREISHLPCLRSRVKVCVSVLCVSVRSDIYIAWSVLSSALQPSDPL